MVFRHVCRILWYASSIKYELPHNNPITPHWVRQWQIKQCYLRRWHWKQYQVMSSYIKWTREGLKWDPGVQVVRKGTLNVTSHPFRWIYRAWHDLSRSSRRQGQDQPAAPSTVQVLSMDRSAEWWRGDPRLCVFTFRVAIYAITAFRPFALTHSPCTFHVYTHAPSQELSVLLSCTVLLR